MEEAETDVCETSAKTPQLKRPSENYTTGVPTKRINEEKPHESKDELNYANKFMPETLDEPMEIASHSSDSFEIRRNIKVKADIHSPSTIPKRIREVEKFMINNHRMPKI